MIRRIISIATFVIEFSGKSVSAFYEPVGCYRLRVRGARLRSQRFSRWSKEVPRLRGPRISRSCSRLLLGQFIAIAGVDAEICWCEESRITITRGPFGPLDYRRLSDRADRLSPQRLCHTSDFLPGPPQKERVRLDTEVLRLPGMRSNSTIPILSRGVRGRTNTGAIQVMNRDNL